MTVTAVREPVGERASRLARPAIHVLVDRCAGCQECIIRCPAGALSMNAELWIAEGEDSLCVGCRQCVRTCPFSAITIEGPALSGDRLQPEEAHPVRLLGDASEIRQGIQGDDAALAEAQRCLECPDPTCVRGCPAHNDIPGFIRAIREGDIQAAHTILRQTSFLPDVCSRVCDQAAQCEGSCSWSLAGQPPVAIGLLERYVCEAQPVPPLDTTSPAGVGLRVAVIGSGPAGIGAASVLVQAGAVVTVFEKDAEPGGLIRWGIPDFTLPDDIASRPWAQLLAMGVELRLNTEIKVGDQEKMLTEFDAIVFAHGASIPIKLPVPGADLEGVTDATWFLKRAKDALESEGGIAEVGLPGRAGKAEAAGRGPAVLVLGAGNTAMDVARSALRLGASRAVCVDWLDEKFALVRPDELAEARGEGVEALFSTTLVELQGEGGRVRRAVLASTVQKERGKLPKVVGGSRQVQDFDLVVMAMGYRVEQDLAKKLPGTPMRKAAKGMPDNRWVASGILHNDASAFCNSNPVGCLAIDRETGFLSASLAVTDRVWVAGDALVGPSTVVESMAQGKRAAEAILRSRPQRTTSGSGAEDVRSGKLPIARRVLVVYDSLTGHTEKVARQVAGSLKGRGAEVKLLPIRRVGLAEITWADMLVVGTWVQGFVVAGVKPAKTTTKWLAGLPRLGGKSAAVFCTYGVSARDVPSRLARSMADRGAEVAAVAAISHSRAENEAAEFAASILDKVNVSASEFVATFTR